MKDPFAEGWDACCEGAGLESCPYPVASGDAALWMDGWHEAVHERLCQAA